MCFRVAAGLKLARNQRCRTLELLGMVEISLPDVRGKNTNRALEVGGDLSAFGLRNGGRRGFDMNRRAPREESEDEQGVNDRAQIDSPSASKSKFRRAGHSFVITYEATVEQSEVLSSESPTPRMD